MPMVLIRRSFAALGWLLGGLLCGIGAAALLLTAMVAMQLPNDVAKAA
jgi:hypothetical protein